MLKLVHVKICHLKGGIINFCKFSSQFDLNLATLIPALCDTDQPEELTQPSIREDILELVFLMVLGPWDMQPIHHN